MLTSYIALAAATGSLTPTPVMESSKYITTPGAVEHSFNMYSAKVYFAGNSQTVVQGNSKGAASGHCSVLVDRGWGLGVVFGVERADLGSNHSRQNGGHYAAHVHTAACNATPSGGDIWRFNDSIGIGDPSNEIFFEVSVDVRGDGSGLGVPRTFGFTSLADARLQRMRSVIMSTTTVALCCDLTPVTVPWAFVSNAPPAPLGPATPTPMSDGPFALADVPWGYWTGGIIVLVIVYAVGVVIASCLCSWRSSAGDKISAFDNPAIAQV